MTATLPTRCCDVAIARLNDGACESACISRSVFILVTRHTAGSKNLCCSKYYRLQTNCAAGPQGTSRISDSRQGSD